MAGQLPVCVNNLSTLRKKSLILTISRAYPDCFLKGFVNQGSTLQMVSTAPTWNPPEHGATAK